MQLELGLEVCAVACGWLFSIVCAFPCASTPIDQLDAVGVCRIYLHGRWSCAEPSRAIAVCARPFESSTSGAAIAYPCAKVCAGYLRSTVRSFSWTLGVISGSLPVASTEHAEPTIVRARSRKAHVL